MNEIKIYTHTPFRTNLSLVEHNQRLTAKKLEELFIKAEKHIEKIKTDGHSNLEFKRLNEEDKKHKSVVFEYLAEDSKRIKSELFKLRLDKNAPVIQQALKEGIRAACVECNFSIENARIIEGTTNILLFDDTIGQFMFGVSLQLPKDPDVDKLAAFLQPFTNRIAQVVLAEVYQTIIFPTLKIIQREQNRKVPLISPVFHHLGFPDIQDPNNNRKAYGRCITCGIPLWTSRTVVIEKTTSWSEKFADAWIVTRKDDQRDNSLLFSSREKASKKENIYLGWGHNLVVDDFGSSDFNFAMDAMTYAQYYYALFDVLSNNLTYSISLSRNLKKLTRTRYMRKTLDELVMTFNITKTEYNDLFFNLQATRSYFLGDVMEKWGTQELLENIENKSTVCASIINRSYQKSVNRSQKIAETLLLLISGVAILEYLKGLAEFTWARKPAAHDPFRGVLDLGQYDPNLMQWIGIGVLLLLSIIYLRSLKNRA
ncbi:hypothetical protein [Neolewinella persica]|uniref:hypothetical protein n=1 Tax=Neolewinella persica TaxID=70998 RepID=UPI0003666317|nr:hypothetical protein [Neolewinella persica]